MKENTIVNDKLNYWRRFTACDILDDELYIALSSNSVLLKGNKKKPRLSILECEQGKDYFARVRAERILVCKGYIYCFDYNKSCVYMFDMMTKSCKLIIDLEKDENMKRKTYDWYVLYKYNDEVFLFVDNDKGYYIIEGNNYSFYEFEGLIWNFDWQNVLTCSSNGFVYLLDKNHCSVIKYNCTSRLFEEYELLFDVSKCEAIQVHNNKMYILVNETRYYIWDCNDCCLISRDISIAITPSLYDHICPTEKCIYLIPGIDNKLVTIGPDGKDSYVEFPEDIGFVIPSGYREIYHKYREYAEDEECRYYASRYYSHILVINKNDGSVHWNKIEWPSKEDYIKQLFQYEPYVFEEYVDLESWLKTVSNL